MKIFLNALVDQSTEYKEVTEKYAQFEVVIFKRHGFQGRNERQKISKKQILIIGIKGKKRKQKENIQGPTRKKNKKEFLHQKMIKTLDFETLAKDDVPLNQKYYKSSQIHKKTRRPFSKAIHLLPKNQKTRFYTPQLIKHSISENNCEAEKTTRQQSKLKYMQ